ncbi:MAG TPA: putative sugar nucleotidyl transferase, partial [Bacteroidia bacterium]|nr:putative sugar nucleotidyl transferase [Bacteroidia bacterium]
MNLILADDQFRDQLLPFAFTRPVADIRVGILTIRHKWEMLLKIPQGTSGSLTSFYLSGRFPLSEGKDCLLINGSLLPDANTLKAIQALKPNQQLVWEGRLIAAMLDRDKLVGKDHVLPFDELESIPYVGTPDLLNNVWEIFTKNDAALRADFQLLTKGRRSEVISGSNQTIQPDQIFIEAGAKVECAI